MDIARPCLSRGKRKHHSTYVSRLTAKVCVIETQIRDIQTLQPSSIDTRNSHVSGGVSRIDNLPVQNGAAIASCVRPARCGTTVNSTPRKITPPKTILKYEYHTPAIPENWLACRHGPPP